MLELIAKLLSDKELNYVYLCTFRKLNIYYNDYTVVIYEYDDNDGLEVLYFNKDGVLHDVWSVMTNVYNEYDVLNDVLEYFERGK